MDENFCYATYAKALQKTFIDEDGNEEITKLLLGYVIDTGKVKDRNNKPLDVDSKMTSELFTRKYNVRKRIQKASGFFDVMAGAKDFFENEVIILINENLRLDLINDIRELIQNDPQIHKLKKEELLSFAREDTLAEFLSETFLYSLVTNNKIEKEEIIEQPQNMLTQEAALFQIVNNVITTLFSSIDLKNSDFQNNELEQIQKLIQQPKNMDGKYIIDIYHCKNFIDIAEKALEILRDEIQENKKQPLVDLSKIDMDWYLRFFECASKIKDETLQNLWARILAGEINNESRCSFRTLETLLNISSDEARCFLYLSDFVFSTVDYRSFIICDNAFRDYFLNSSFAIYENDIRYMEYCGLLQPMQNGILPTSEIIGHYLYYGDWRLQILRKDGLEPIRLDFYPLTEAARQLLPLIRGKRTACKAYLVKFGRIMRREYGDKADVYVSTVVRNEHGRIVFVDSDDILPENDNEPFWLY